MNRIMLVDDEPNILNALRRALAGEPYAIEAYTDPEQALERFDAAPCDLVLSDYRMPRMNGVALLEAVKARQPDTLRIILSGYADLDAVISAINVAEIYRFLAKPWEDYDLKAVIANALSHYAVLGENRRLADQVRAQQKLLDQQAAEIARLESEHPGITQVLRDADGAVLIGGEP
jgi:two-component system, probable response regulator PhcQ